MKALLLNLFANLKNDTEKAYHLNCCYLGEMDGKYLFTDEFENTIEFHSFSEKISTEFDLNGTKEIGRKFRLTYVFIEEDEYEEIELEIIKMEES